MDEFESLGKQIVALDRVTRRLLDEVISVMTATSAMILSFGPVSGSVEIGGGVLQLEVRVDG